MYKGGNLDTDALKAFVAVATTGSFSQAGSALYLTQPAISKRIATLENMLGNELFDRIGRKVSLTEAGRALLPRAQDILAATEEAVRTINDLSGQVRGELKLTTSHHMGLHHLPGFLRRFNDNYPDVRLRLDFQDSEIAMEQVLSGQVELAALTLASHTNEKLVEAVVWDDPLVFVANKEHPLSRLTAPDLADLCQFPAILPETNTYTTQLVNRLFTDAGLQLESHLATNYLETIKMLVTIGLGWAVLPQTLLDTSELIQLTVDCPAIIRRLGIIHHRNRRLSNASKAFLQLLG